MTTIYHLTRKTGSKKFTIAMYLPAGNECIAEIEDIFRLNGQDTHPCNIETEAVCNQKTWKGYTEECPIFYHDKPTREYLQNKGYNERDEALRDYQRGDLTEREYLDFCSESYKRQDAAGKTAEHENTYTTTEAIDSAISEWITKYPTEEEQREASRQAKQAAYNMVQGEGAAQYTFDLAPETQLSLF